MPRMFAALPNGESYIDANTVRVKAKGSLDFRRLDTAIRERIPSGPAARKKPHPKGIERFSLDRLICARHVQGDRAMRALGTLGGGNRFIELGRDGGGDLWLTVHSESRILGQQVCDYYLRTGSQELLRRGIWSTNIGKGTLDEAPFAYRSCAQIEAAFGETVEIADVIAPLYNFKAGGEA